MSGFQVGPIKKTTHVLRVSMIGCNYCPVTAANRRNLKSDEMEETLFLTDRTIQPQIFQSMFGGCPLIP